jgi:hypothetical protein
VVLEFSSNVHMGQECAHVVVVLLATLCDYCFCLLGVVGR